MIQPGKARGVWDAEKARRSTILAVARECSRLSLPYVVPRNYEDIGEQGEPYDQVNIQESTQSMGARGAANMSSILTMVMAPTVDPLMETQPNPETAVRLMQDGPRQLQGLAQLKLQDALVTGLLENGRGGKQANASYSGFRSRLLTAITQFVVTGDVAGFLDDNMRLHVYRREQYIVIRDTSGQVLSMIIAEWIDPLYLSDDELKSVKLKRSDLEETERWTERRKLRLTAVDYIHDDDEWHIWQEIDGLVVGDSTRREKINPYFTVAFTLSPGDAYGHGPIEMNLADLAMLESLEMSRRDLLSNASRRLIAVDSGSGVSDKDMTELPNGAYLHGARVVDGKVQDIAPFSFGDIRDFQMLTAAIEQKTESLGRSLLIESDMQPTGDRVTATQIRRIAQELEFRNMAGLVPIADQLIGPIVRRAAHIAHKSGAVKRAIGDMIVPLKDQTQVPAVGLNVMFQDQKIRQIQELVQTAAAMGEPAMAQLDMEQLMGTMVRLLNLTDSGNIVKTNQQVQQDRRQQLADQAEADQLSRQVPQGQ